MKTKGYKFYNTVTGWFIFLVAAIVYLMTIEPTASFWDCGEFITTAFTLQVGHPPGAPLFMIMGAHFHHVCRKYCTGSCYGEHYVGTGECVYHYVSVLDHHPYGL